MKILWLGHSAFLIYCNGKKILIDPFVSGSGKFPQSCREEVENPDYIVLTHGHGDHIGDTLSLYSAGRTRVVANFEICNWLKSKGIRNCVDMNIGGSHVEKGIRFTMVQAVHSSSIEDEGSIIYGGLAAGFIISYDNKSVYHFGDTDIFGDMGLIQRLYSPDIGLIPIGGRYTMSPESAAFACNEYFEFKTVVPMHYGTFPPIARDVEDFAGRLKRKDSLCCLRPGEHIEL